MSKANDLIVVSRAEIEELIEATKLIPHSFYEGKGMAYQHIIDNLSRPLSPILEKAWDDIELIYWANNSHAKNNELYLTIDDLEQIKSEKQNFLNSDL